MAFHSAAPKKRGRPTNEMIAERQRLAEVQSARNPPITSFFKNAASFRQPLFTKPNKKADRTTSIDTNAEEGTPALSAQHAAPTSIPSAVPTPAGRAKKLSSITIDDSDPEESTSSQGRKSAKLIHGPSPVKRPNLEHGNQVNLIIIDDSDPEDIAHEGHHSCESIRASAKSPEKRPCPAGKTDIVTLPDSGSEESDSPPVRPLDIEPTGEAAQTTSPGYDLGDTDDPFGDAGTANSAESRALQRKVIEAYDAVVPDHPKMRENLTCTIPQGYKSDTITRGRPIGAEYTKLKKGACKEAMFKIPLVRWRCAVFAHEYMTVVHGYEGPPWEVGKAPTEELLTLLRSGHCIPPYWYNDNKIESIRGAGSKKKVRANPVTVFPLWGDATKCGACKGYHGGHSVRYSIVIQLGIESITPAEICKHTDEFDELSHPCGISPCINHPGYESRELNVSNVHPGSGDKRDDTCFKLSDECTHGETKLGPCKPHLHRKYHTKPLLSARVKKLRDALKDFYGEKKVACAWCPKTFADRALWLLHVREAHTPEQPYHDPKDYAFECPRCSRLFAAQAFTLHVVKSFRNEACPPPTTGKKNEGTKFLRGLLGKSIPTKKQPTGYFAWETKHRAALQNQD